MIALKAPWNERNGKLSLLKLVVFISLFAPAAWIAYQWTAGLLGPKPVLEALHATGQWAVRFTLLSLLVTPLRRVAGWPKLIALRRMLGLSAFSYALAHFCIYIGPDQDFAPLHAAAEIVSHFNLTIGFVALLGLSALAATSTDAMIKRMGALRWSRFQRAALEPVPQADLFHRYSGDRSFLFAIQRHRVGTHVDDGPLLHFDDLSGSAKTGLAGMGRCNGRCRHGVLRHGVARGDELRARSPH
jgi:methionine sulfoxide reductase heme-binding subunit